MLPGYSRQKSEVSSPDVSEHLSIPLAPLRQNALNVVLIAPVTGQDVVLDEIDQLIIPLSMLQCKVHPDDLPSTASSMLHLGPSLCMIL
jgi:hypothetical protein